MPQALTQAFNPIEGLSSSATQGGCCRSCCLSLTQAVGMTKGKQACCFQEVGIKEYLSLPTFHCPIQIHELQVGPSCLGDFTIKRREN